MPSSFDFYGSSFPKIKEGFGYLKLFYFIAKEQAPQDLVIFFRIGLLKGLVLSSE